LPLTSFLAVDLIVYAESSSYGRKTWYDDVIESTESFGLSGPDAWVQNKWRKKIKGTRNVGQCQRDGRPAKYRWRPLFNAAKFG